jgi:dihydrofolate reductase
MPPAGRVHGRCQGADHHGAGGRRRARLDGYVASVDGSGDWIAAGGSDDALSWTVETVSNAGAHLMGATTYAVMANYPGASGLLAKPMNEIPRVVFSDSLSSADWGETRIAAGDPAPAVTRLKQECSDGYLLAHGGARLPDRCRDRLDRRVPPSHPPGRPGAGERIFLAPLTIERVSTTSSAAGPSPTSSRRTRDRAPRSL